MTTPSEPEARYAPTVARVYRNDRLEVTWEPSLCVHFAACIQGSAAAFDPRRHPWVNIDAETPERIAEIVATCPTGALHALWHDGRPAETPPETTAAFPMRDGPLLVNGRFRVLDRAGHVIREDTRIALCRCGHSRNKPYCDDSHFRTGFRSNDPQMDGAPQEHGHH